MKSSILPEYYAAVFPTRLGSFALAVDAQGALVATAFGGLAELQQRVGAAQWTESADRTANARRDVEAYFADRSHVFQTPVAAPGSAFQQKVWQALSAIPRGETRSYGQLAQQLHSSPRAVGRANATNPVCLIVPCHRVIGTDGSLTGYAFGEELKQRLLEWEGVKVSLPSSPSAVGRAHATNPVRLDAKVLPPQSADAA
jgi:methylated-DNA-[protein]-cysteine S-methyltransferase